MNYAFLFHILTSNHLNNYACIACAVRISMNLFSHCFDSPMYGVRYAYNVFMQPSFISSSYRPQPILLSPDGENNNVVWCMLGIIACSAVNRVFSSA